MGISLWHLAVVTHNSCTKKAQTKACGFNITGDSLWKKMSFGETLGTNMEDRDTRGAVGESTGL